uniref:Uncharacterized protein n=1 Tax=Fagus sylvatica TaxID=28930 RepID=A0A2N9HND1_FAGSY
MLIISPHVHEVLRGRRYDSGSDGGGLHGLQHGLDPLGRFPPGGEPNLAAIAVHGPERDGAERAGAELGRLVAFEGNADESGAHFLDKLGGHDGELEEENGFGGEAIVLDAEPDVASAWAEDGSNHHGLGCARLGKTDGADRGVVAGGGGGLGVLVLVLGFLVSAFGEIVSKRGAKAFLGGCCGG